MTRRKGDSDVRLGIVGTAALALLLVASLSLGGVQDLLGGRTYTAEFAEAGGLRAGDRVVASGLTVGSVREVRLARDRVEVEFILDEDAVTLGERTSAAIVSQTVLGRRALEVLPSGDGELRSAIPLSRTAAPYDVTQALADVTTTIEELDTDKLVQATEASARVLAAAAPTVGPALRGISDLSQLIADRDRELASLLESTAGVSGLLRERQDQIVSLASDGSVLLATLNARSAALQQLLVNSVQMADQVEGLIDDNEKVLGPALKEVRGVLATTRKHKADIEHALKSASPLLRELGEVVAAFPGFNVYIPNVPPTNLVPNLSDLLMGQIP